MQFTQILTPLLWIGLIIYLIFSKKKFTFPDTELSYKSIIFLGLVSLTAVIVNVSIFVVAYTKAYRPDFGYQSITKQIDFHLYLPQKLPTGDEQVSKFYFDEKVITGYPKAVRFAFDIPISSIAKGEKSKVTLITETKVDPSFSIENYISANTKTTTPLKSQLLVLSKQQDSFVILQTSDFVNTVFVKTIDNVFIEISSIRESTDNLISIANNLE